MSDWKPSLYMEFGKERTQPSIDLVTRIDHDNPRRLIDIGCGPGNSTNVLRSRWAHAEIIGLDNSRTMIAEAQSMYPDMEWLCMDATGDLSALGRFDVVFSNAAIQWMPNQESLILKLLGMLNPGGLLAVQVPNTENMPIHTELMKLISSKKWGRYFSEAAESYLMYQADYYYDIVSQRTRDIAMWETRYFHIMNTHADLVTWYSASGLRIYLECLKDETQKADFLRDYEAALATGYPVQPDCRILFPFTRIFFIARTTTAA